MRRAISAGAVAATLAIIFVLPVLAAELTSPCSMDLVSHSGTTVDSPQVDAALSVSGPIAEGDVGSQSRPFKVDPEGGVDFRFDTGTTVFQGNHWAVYAQGLPVPILQGSDDNPGDLDETGFVTLNDAIKALPFRVVGTFFVSGDLYGNQDTNHCHGEGYVQVLGDPVGTIPWDIAAALIVLSGLVLLVATPYSTTWETDPNAGERLHSTPLDPETQLGQDRS
jgi:hypothetical protein